MRQKVRQKKIVIRDFLKLKNKRGFHRLLILHKYLLPLLTQLQINNAKITIDLNHPLSRIPLIKALPYLEYFKCCFGKPKKDFRLAVKKALLRKMDMKIPKSEI